MSDTTIVQQVDIVQLIEEVIRRSAQPQLQLAFSLINDPLFAALASWYVTYQQDTLATPANPLVIGPGATFEAIPKQEESGVLRVGTMSVDNPNVRYIISWKQGRRTTEFNYSINDLLFIGLDRPIGNVPYIAQAANVVNPYTSQTVPVYTLVFTSNPWEAWYNGYIEAKIYNPTPTSATVWFLHFERYIVDPGLMEFINSYLQKARLLPPFPVYQTSS